MHNPNTSDLHTTSNYELDALYNYLRSPLINPMNLRRVFITMLKSFFNNKDNFKAFLNDTYPDFNYTYSNKALDQDSSSPSILTIVGTDEYVDSVDKAEKDTLTYQPKLVVGIGDIQYQPVGTLDNVVAFNEENGKLTYSMQSTTTVDVSCYTTNFLDCNILAYLVNCFLCGLRYNIKKFMCIREFLPTNMSNPMTINKEDAKKIYMSKVTFSINYLTTWSTREEAAILRHVYINVNSKINNT